MLALWPALIFAYDNDKTHPLLTAQAIDLFEANASKTFISAEDRSIILGSIAEDADPRYLEHFYDPINNVGLDRGRFSSSKQWALGQAIVANDFTWDNAIYQYVYGDKLQGLEALGHILHLIQDKTVPDHTRDDPHPIVSTYETFAKTQNAMPPAQPVYLSSLNDYFDQVAKFTNANFFSDDTILKYYLEPKNFTESWQKSSLGVDENFGVGNFGKLVLIKRFRDGRGILQTSYSVSDTDNKVMSAYWNTLAPKAVGYSAGVIKLFFDEVKKEQEIHALQKAHEPWWQRLVEAAKLKIDQALAMVKIAKNNPTIPPVTKLDPIVVKTPTEVGMTMMPEQIRLERLTVLENRLRALRAELETLTSANQNQVVTIIRSVNSSLASAGVAPMAEAPSLEAPTTTEEVATTTATTTEEVVAKPLSIDLAIDTCSFSLATGACLLASTSSLNFSWTPTVAGDYNYELVKFAENVDDWEIWDSSVVYSGPNRTTSVQTNMGPNDFVYEIKWQIIAKATSTGEIVASSSVFSTYFHPRPLVINEIGWAGTTASDKDEWLELRNDSDKTIDLNNFYLTNVANDSKIILSGQIYSRSYYLIERGSDEVISNRSADLIDNFGADLGVKAFNVNNLGFKLWQKKTAGDVLIDETPVWNKVGNSPASLELGWLNRSARDASNWSDHSGCNEPDGPCALDRNATTTFGTPRAINFASIPRLI